MSSKNSSVAWSKSSSFSFSTLSIIKDMDLESSRQSKISNYNNYNAVENDASLELMKNGDFLVQQIYERSSTNSQQKEDTSAGSQELTEFQVQYERPVCPLKLIEEKVMVG